MKLLPLILALTLFQGGDDEFRIQIETPEEMKDEVQNPAPDPSAEEKKPYDEFMEKVVPVLVASLGTIFIVLLVTHVIVWGIVAYILAGCLRVVPESYRTMSPGAAYLMVVPILHYFWVPIVFLNITASHARFFQAAGRNDVGDCGRTLAVWTAVCWYLSLFLVIPALPLGFLLLFLFAAVHYYKGQAAATIALGRA